MSAHVCAFQPTDKPPCGEPASALVYKGTAAHLDSDRSWRPMCGRPAAMMSSTFYPATTPLDDGGTWVVAMRALPKLRCAACGWYEGDPVCDVDCPGDLQAAERVL